MRQRILAAGVTVLFVGMAVGTYAQPTRPSATRPTETTQASSSERVYTATSLPARYDIALDPRQMWTRLPRWAKDATQGPDGRVWLEVSAPHGALTMEAVEALIRREFAQPMPQMPLIRPILFEPGGRVWFLAHSGINASGWRGILVGYDGKTFTTPSGESEKSLHRGSMRMLGGPGRRGSVMCMHVDGRTFFSAPGVICIFDGTQWATREMPNVPAGGRQNPGGVTDLYRFYAEPDGKGLLAISSHPSNPVWRWRGGEWTQHATGIVSNAPEQGRGMRTGPMEMVIGAAPRHHGVWLLTAAEGLTFIPFDEVEADVGQPLSIEQVVEELANPETRAGARQELLLHGKAAEAEIQKAIPRASDEIKELLHDIQGRLKPRAQPMPGMMRPDRHLSWRLGEYTVSSVTYVHALPDGGTIIGAWRVVDKAGRPAAPTPAPPTPASPDLPPDPDRPPPAHAVLLQEPGGKFRVLGGRDLLATIPPMRVVNATDTEPAGLKVVDNGKRVWTTAGVQGEPPGLLDLASGQIVEQIPLPGVGGVLAADREGAMFLRAHHSRSSNEMLVYRRAGLDTRREITPIAHGKALVSRPYHAEHFTADGCFWFFQPSKNAENQQVAARFNGKTIDVYPESAFPSGKGASSPVVVTGRDGILVDAGKTWFLTSPRGTWREATIEALISNHAGEMARTFTGPRPLRLGEQPTHVQADRAGNVWMLRQPGGEVKVFSGGSWLDAADALRKAGSVRARAYILLPLADTGKILAADYVPRGPKPVARGKTAFVLSVAEQKIVAEPVPELSSLYASQKLEYAPGGDPWVEFVADENAPYTPSVCRMTAHGPADVVNDARLLLGDGEGNVWVSMTSGDKTAIRIYRGGTAIPGELDLPLSSREIWWEPGGRICYESVLGLHTFKVNPRGDRIAAIDHQTLRFAGIHGRIELRGVSPLGFVVVTGLSAQGPAGPNVHFYPMALP